MQKQRVYLSLGSNQGDKRAYLKEAVRRLDNLEKSRIIRISSLYETAAWGRTDQDNFYNLVLVLETELEPLELLDRTQKIELDLGRTRQVHWGPRTLDIDLLIFGQLELDLNRLKIPHPHMLKRRFVMEPLAEIAPELEINGRRSRDYLEELAHEGLEKIGDLYQR